MEITLDKKALKLIRASAEDAVEEGDTESLREDIYEAFSEDQIEQIDRRLEGSDFMEFLTDLLEDWSQDDADELLELLESKLSEIDLDLRFEKATAAAADDDEDDEDDDFDDDEDEDEEDEDEEDFDDLDEEEEEDDDE
jgi:RNA binding exosome subunit